MVSGQDFLKVVGVNGIYLLGKLLLKNLNAPSRNNYLVTGLSMDSSYCYY